MLSYTLLLFGIYDGLGNEMFLLFSSKNVSRVALFWFQFFSPLSKVKDEAQNGSYSPMISQSSFRYLLLHQFALGRCDEWTPRYLWAPCHLSSFFSILRNTVHVDSFSRSKDESFVEMAAGAHDEVRFIYCLLTSWFQYLRDLSAFSWFYRPAIVWVTMKEHLFFHFRFVGKVSACLVWVVRQSVDGKKSYHFICLPFENNMLISGCFHIIKACSFNRYSPLYSSESIRSVCSLLLNLTNFYASGFFEKKEKRNWDLDETEELS